MLHQSLRELVAVRGAGVLAEAEELRGALDDFLSEDEATLGELNLLVDAVRLGGLRRVLDVLDHGAKPDAAIQEAGVALARDRGTDDPTRSCWALAALCFALGRVDESLVRTYAAQGGTMSVPGPPTAPHGGAPEPAAPAPPPAPVGVGPPTHVLDGDPPGGTTAPGPAPVPPAPPPGRVPPVIPEERSGRAGRYLLVVLAALVVGGLVAAGIILLRSGDDPTGDDGDDGGGSPVIADDAIVTSVNDGGSSSIYSFDPEGGEWEELTDGPDHTLPAVSPDRSMVTYMDGPPGGPAVLMALDPQTQEGTPVFGDTGPCAHAARPAWSPDGSQLAVRCLGEGDEIPGIYLADVGAELPLEASAEPVVPGDLAYGAPTWVTDDTFIYTAFGDASEDTSYLFSYSVETGETSTLTDADDGFLTHPDWSDEGRLLFLRHDDPSSELGTLVTSDAAVSGPEDLGEAQVGHPAWSPDGSQIAFVVPDEDGTERLATADADDVDDFTLVPDPPDGQTGIPAWGSR